MATAAVNSKTVLEIIDSVRNNVCRALDLAYKKEVEEITEKYSKPRTWFGFFSRPYSSKELDQEIKMISRYSGEKPNCYYFLKIGTRQVLGLCERLEMLTEISSGDITLSDEQIELLNRWK